MLLGQGRVNLKPVITHCFPLTRVLEAFRVAEHEKATALKVMLTY
jgi:threonine dehydrogenase-like Zn-dependent dehydrogenase